MRDFLPKRTPEKGSLLILRLIKFRSINQGHPALNEHLELQNGRRIKISNSSRNHFSDPPAAVRRNTKSEKLVNEFSRSAKIETKGSTAARGVMTRVNDLTVGKADTLRCRTYVFDFLVEHPEEVLLARGNLAGRKNAVNSDRGWKIVLPLRQQRSTERFHFYRLPLVAVLELLAHLGLVLHALLFFRFRLVRRHWKLENFG